jgi:hypothetical protein
VVLLDPTSGEPEVLNTLRTSLMDISADKTKADPLSILIFASAVTDDPVAAAERYGFVALEKHLQDVIPSMRNRFAGAARSLMWHSNLKMKSIFKSPEPIFECPVLLVACSVEHPVFKGVTGPERVEQFWAPLCHLPPTIYILKDYHHLDLPIADILGVPVVQFLCSISSHASSIQSLHVARVRSRRLRSGIIAAQNVYRQRWQEFEQHSYTGAHSTHPV